MSRSIQTFFFSLCIAVGMVATGCDLNEDPGPRPDSGSGGRGGSGGGVDLPGGGSGGQGGAGGTDEPLTVEIDKVQPSTGPTQGGTRVTITGRGFLRGMADKDRATETTTVLFGEHPAQDTEVIDDQTIFTTTPEGPMGSATVTVQTPSGDSSCVGCFDYFEPLVLLSLISAQPKTGPVEGGTTVTLRGEGFRGGFDVFFGQGAAVDVKVLDSSTLEVTSPPGDIGFVDVKVVRDDGEEATLSSAFSYFTPFSGGASGGPLAGVLDVMAVIASGENVGGPVSDCEVTVNIDEDTSLLELTDEKGKASFTSPALVDAVTVSVGCDGYEAATIVSQTSANLTVHLSE